MRCPSRGACASCAEWPVTWTEEENDETAEEDAAEDEEDTDINIVPSDESEFVTGHCRDSGGESPVRSTSDGRVRLLW